MDYYCACSNHDIRQPPACLCHSRNNLKSPAPLSSPPLSPRQKPRPCCNPPRGRQSPERRYSSMAVDRMYNCCCRKSCRPSETQRKWKHEPRRNNFPSPLYRCIQSCMQKELDYHNSRKHPRNCCNCSHSSFEYEDEDDDDDDEIHQYPCPYCVEGYEDDIDDLDAYDSVTDTICLCNTPSGHQNKRDGGRIPRCVRELSTKDKPCACNLRIMDLQAHQPTSKASGAKEISTQSMRSSFQVDQGHANKHGKLNSKTGSKHEETNNSNLDHHKNNSHRQVRNSPRSSALNKTDQNNSMMNQLYRHLSGEHNRNPSVFNGVFDGREYTRSSLDDVDHGHNHHGHQQESFFAKSCMKATCPFLNQTSVDLREHGAYENGRKVCTVKTCRFQEPCTKKPCAYCKELLRKLAEHEEDEHGGGSKDLGDKGSRRESRIVSHSDQSIGSDSSTLSESATSRVKSLHQTSTTTKDFCPKPQEGCYNPKCNKEKTPKNPQDSDYLGGDHTVFPVTETTDEIAEVPAVKEHLELKEFSFRPKSKHILGPQEERIPRFYFPPSASADTADSTAALEEDSGTPVTANYMVNLTTDLNTSHISLSGSSDIILNEALVTPSKSVESNEQAMAAFNALDPVQEVSVEESITSSFTSNSKKSAPTQISTNKAYNLMTYNVGIQYPSSSQVETPGWNKQTNKFINADTRRYEQGFGWPTFKIFPSKTRKLLVHSYPLAQRKVSPTRKRSASPKKHQ